MEETIEKLTKLKENDLLLEQKSIQFSLLSASGYFEEDLEELYDFETDPHEIRNLAVEPESAELLGRGRIRLFQWLEEKELGFGAAALPLRIALTGSTGGPGVFDIVVLIGKDEAIQRIRTATSKISVSVAS